eukprot:5938377-Amphidinium_carterae.2
MRFRWRYGCRKNPRSGISNSGEPLSPFMPYCSSVQSTCLGGGGLSTEGASDVEGSLVVEATCMPGLAMPTLWLRCRPES